MHRLIKNLNRGLFTILGLIAITGSVLFGHQMLTPDTGETALAALNCPSGSTLSGGQCVSSTPSSYTCPSGQTVSGTNCIGTVQTGTQYSCPSGGTSDGAGNCIASNASPVQTGDGCLNIEVPVTYNGANYCHAPGYYGTYVYGYRNECNSGISESTIMSGADGPQGQAYNGNWLGSSIGFVIYYPEKYRIESFCYAFSQTFISSFRTNNNPSRYWRIPGRYTANYSYAATGTPSYGTGIVGAATPLYGTNVTPTSYTPDAGQITGISCNNTSPVVGSSINCTIVGSGAPSGVPYGGSVTLTIDNGGGTSTCTFSGSATATCGAVSVGSTVGAKTVTTSSGGSLSINVIRINFGKVDWVFNPDQGSNAPLFRSTNNTSIKAINFRTPNDLTPTSNTRYTCIFEYRNLNDRLASSPTWTALNTPPIPYTTGTGANSGCAVNLTKQQRGSALNYGLRLTITDTTNTTPSSTNPNTYIFYNEYIFRFQGAGTASGG